MVPLRLFLAFFCSGFAALLCQIVWQRMLGIFAGSDTVSAAWVVGAFLAGLGLGSIGGAKVADRLSARTALLVFAVAELGVGIFALASKAFLYDWLAREVAGSVAAPGAVFALCFVGLLAPTVLMGAALPLLARAVSHALDGLAERIGLLYAVNTLGAALGALLGGWWLVGDLGFVRALQLAAGLDGLAAVIALSLASRFSRTPPPQRTSAAPPPGAAIPGLLPWCLLVFLSGYVIVALEILWVRVLGQVGQYHAYLFPTVLGVFLLADGLGMVLGARWLRRIADPRPAFFIAQGTGFVLAVLLIGLLWWLLPHPPLATVMNVDGLRFGRESLSVLVVLAVLVVGPPSFAIGLTFAFVQKAVQRDLASVGARVGWIQFATIAGNVAGSLGTGLASLHWLGTTGTLRLLGAVTLLLLLGWLWRARRWRGPETVLAVLCGLSLVAVPGSLAWWSRFHAAGPDQAVIVAEDRSGVALFRGDPGAGDEARGQFFIQGFSQARIPFLDIHQFLGAVGPLLHPSPRQVLAIGIGSGGTPWACGIRAESQVRAIEIVGPVLTVVSEVAARHPNSPIARMIADPRWTLEVGDGRRLLSRETTRYDVIEADAVLPAGSLAGLLYSAEFLEQVRERLAPGGLYVQWAPTPRTVKTFVSVFPHVLLLRPASVLVGSNDPITFDPEALRAAFRVPAHQAHLRAGTPWVDDWGALFAEEPVRWTPGREPSVPPLTDLFPRDEFFLNN